MPELQKLMLLMRETDVENMDFIRRQKHPLSKSGAFKRAAEIYARVLRAECEEQMIRMLEVFENGPASHPEAAMIAANVRSSDLDELPEEFR